MFFLLSGEGPTDLGHCDRSGSDYCDLENENFSSGPMAHIVDKLVEKHLDFSIMEYQTIGYVNEKGLSREIKKNKSHKFPGKREKKGTLCFRKNAYALGSIAKKMEEEKGDIIAILFRDCDGTCASPPTEWEDKLFSIHNGFSEAGFKRGIAMLPKPKSEAWLICAMQEPPYQNCAKLENLPGNDKSPNAPKKVLEEITGQIQNSTNLNELIVEGAVDPGKIDMPSFNQFKKELEEAIKNSN